jgi:hypothetical protein
MEAVEMGYKGNYSLILVRPPTLMTHKPARLLIVSVALALGKGECS